jgi:hypothetical protein
MMWRKLSLAVVLLGSLILPTIAPAADDVLTVVPDSALAVAVVNHLDQTQAKIVKLGKQLQVPDGALTMMTGTLTGLREMAKVDKDGAVAIAAVPGVDFGAPIPLMIVPTTDYEAFLKNVNAENVKGKVAEVTIAGQEFLATEKNGFAVLTNGADRKTFKAMLRKTGGAADQLAALDDWRSEQDAYFIALPGGIKFAQQNILAGLAAGKAAVVEAGENTEMALAGLQMYESMFQAMDKELSHVAVGVQLEDDGAVRVVSRTLLAPNGMLAKAAKKAKPFNGNPLAGLPQGEFFIAGGGVIPTEMYGPLMDFSFEMIKMYPGGDQVSKEDLKKLKEISLKSIGGMRSMAMLLGVGDDETPLYGNMIMVVQVDNADEYLDIYESSMREMIALGEKTDNPLFKSYQLERLEIDGKSGLKLTMNMDVLLGADQPPEAKQALEAMFGDASELDVFMVAANATTVVGSYISQESLKAAIKAVGNAELQLIRQDDVKKTFEMLPSGSQFVGLWSPRGTFQFVRRLMDQMQPGAAAMMPEFPKTSPIGFTLQVSPAGLETEMVIPADVLTSTAELIQKFNPARNGPVVPD